jgi:hypothetical protein
MVVVVGVIDANRCRLCFSWNNNDRRIKIELELLLFSIRMSQRFIK